MHLRILTPERTVLDETGVTFVSARTDDGEFGVKPGHLPIVAPLKIAVLTYQKGSQTTQVAVMGGMFHNEKDVVTVLCSAAELSGEIDEVRAQHAMERAQAMLKDKAGTLDAQRAEAALARATARLKAAGKQPAGKL